MNELGRSFQVSLDLNYMIYLKVQKLALAIAAVFMSFSYADDKVPIYNDNNQIMFYLRFYQQGQSAYFPEGDLSDLKQASSSYNLNNDDILAIKDGFSYLANVFENNSPVQIGIVANEDFTNNAFGTAGYDDNNQFLAPEIADSAISNDILAGIFYVNKWTITEDGHLPYANITLLPNNYMPSLSPISVHEASHIMGIVSLASESLFNDDTAQISLNEFSQFDRHLYDLNGNNLANAEYHLEISYDDAVMQDDKAFISYGYHNLWDIYDQYGYVSFESGVYFSGENVSKALNGALLEHANGITGNLYPGIPIEGFEMGDYPDWSHFELQGSLLSHQSFRNWNTLMEIEMAALEDLGFKIDRRKHFGYSIYNSGTASSRYSFINTNPYYERSSDGSAYLTGVASSTAYGIGLHIYGSYTDVTQKADILANGAYSAGIRLEGINNNLQTDKDSLIHVNGAFGYGLLVDFGKEHEITHNGSIEALGPGGIGVAFDFGCGPIGSMFSGIGSYFVYGNVNGLIDEDKIAGALVEDFNVYGSIKGQYASIYAADNAYVKNINIYEGAYLKGDIINNWDPNLNNFSNLDNFTAVTDTKNAFTNLNFKTNSINEHIAVDGNIIGDKAIKFFNYADAAVNGYAEVYDFYNASNISFAGSNADGLALYVANNLTLSSSSNLGLNFDGSGNIQNKIAVGANASVAGGLILSTVQDFYASNSDLIVDVDSASIIDASNISGNFDDDNIKINNSSNTLNFNIVSSLDHQVTISVARDKDAYSQYAYDFTTNNVANAVLFSAQDSNTQLADIIAYLDFNGANEARSALKKLSAADYDVSSYINMQHLELINNTIRASHAENMHADNDVFIKSFYADSSYDDSNYNFDYNSYGFIVGANLIKSLNASLALNLGASKLEGNISHNKQREHKSSSALIGVNLNFFNKHKDLYLLLSSNYMYIDAQAKRSFYLADKQYNNKADFNAYALLNSISLAKDFSFNKVNFNLYTALQYNYYYQDSFSEQGSSSALKLENNHEQAFPFRIGSNIKYDIFSDKDSSLAINFDAAFKVNLISNSYDSSYSFADSGYTIRSSTDFKSNAGIEAGTRISYENKQGFSCSLGMAAGFNDADYSVNANFAAGFYF